jgi:hypothetical protein
MPGLNIFPEVEFKAYMEQKACEFFQAYGFVAQEDEEDEEAAAAAAAAAAEAAAAHWQPRRRRRRRLWTSILATVLIEAR